MVLNDEGHHCWRPAPADQQVENVDTSRKGRRNREDLTREEAKELEENKNEARVWLQGLDAINNCLGKDQPGIAYCIDLSATPFYIKGSGFSEGQPFPWLVSDFGLVDAIESGITKIPRLPVTDASNSRDDAGRPDPKYFRLWRHIVERLQPVEKFGSGKPKPEPCYREAEGALKQLAGQWKVRFDLIQAATPNQEQIPPVMIVVCDNTEIADYFYRKISGESESDVVTLEDIEDHEDEEEEDESPKKKGKKQTVFGKSAILDQFTNTKDRRYTIRIDVEMLRKAESEDPAITKQKAEEQLRRVIATVGKKGYPGEHVRCVVSVAMLTEGWDANNVTHILGVRAFGSQLLCEQVVGRGLRRMNYHAEPDASGKLLLPPEYVDVYGIPFTMIPFKGKPTDQPGTEDPPRNRVFAYKDDREEMEMRFPYVEGYHFKMSKGILRCDIDSMEPMSIDTKLEPTTTYLRPAAGYVDTAKHSNAGFEYVEQTRQSYYDQIHFQTILFLITQELIDEFQSSTRNQDKKARVLALQSRHQLFPQVYEFVRQYVNRKVAFNGVDERELGLERYSQLVVERLRAAIHPDDSQGEPPLLPILNPYRPCGTTADVDFQTTRPTVLSVKSQINSVVLHSSWEADAVTVMDSPEASEIVSCFARNDHLDLKVPYEFMGINHGYEPDFLVRLTNGVTVLLEIKGHEHTAEQNNSKHQAARQWVTAVNNMKDEVFGQWAFLVCRDVEMLLPELAKLVGTTAQPFSLKKTGLLV